MKREVFLARNIVLNCRNNIFFLVLIFISFANISFAQGKGYGIDILPQFEPLVEKNSGQISSFSFAIINSTNKDYEVIEEIDLPKGWSTIPFKFNPFAIAKGERRVRVFAIQIPYNARAKDYKIKYKIRGTNSSVYAEISFSITVLPYSKISSEIKKKPRFVISGKEYNVQFGIINESNVEKK
jgi:hypothetical protein